MRKARISCSIDERIGKVDPFIYGHFIEHLAECIYGGLWAEMLANRKFAGHDQPKGKRVTPEQYGIPWPWHAVNRGANVRYTHDNTVFYNGLQSQRVDLYEADGRPHGVAQGSLAIEKGMTYVVRVVLSQEGLEGPIRVGLGKGETIYAEKIIPSLEIGWQTLDFPLPVDVGDDEAEFSITIDQPGKLWVGAVSLMPSDNLNGWRRDVVELIREIRPPVLRYPGGNFVSGYHWEDGIGHRDSRPIRYDYAWHVWEPNDVGIDEFMQLCDLLGCEPYISVNAGNGSAQEAAAWVEYCNGAANTVYGSKRAANGHPEPYELKYWGIGNEMYGNWQIGHCDPETFARRHVQFAKAMRAVDGDIILLGVGDMPDRPGQWLETITEMAGEYVDLMTVHHYTRVPSDLDEATQDALVVSCPEHIATLLDETRRILDELGPEGHFIGISFDEWNVTHRRPDGRRRQNYALRDGLYAAGMFNIFQRRCTSVTMANIAQLVNLLGVIETSQTDAYGTPIFEAFKLYINHCGNIALVTQVDSETFDVPALGNIPEQKGISYLSASATLDSERNLVCLAVINRHSTDDIVTTVEVKGLGPTSEARVWELNGPGMDARNTFDVHDRVTIRDRGAVAAGNRFEYSFPAHSVTLLEIERG